MTTIEIIPASPGFAVLEFLPPRPSNRNPAHSHPVIAWRITDQTDVVPITLNARINRQQHYYIQQTGAQQVYSTEGRVYDHIDYAREAYEAAQKEG